MKEYTVLKSQIQIIFNGRFLSVCFFRVISDTAQQLQTYTCRQLMIQGEIQANFILEKVPNIFNLANHAGEIAGNSYYIYIQKFKCYIININYVITIIQLCYSYLSNDYYDYIHNNLSFYFYIIIIILQRRKASTQVWYQHS